MSAKYATGCKRPDAAKLASHEPAETAHDGIRRRVEGHRSGAAPLPSSGAITASRPRANQGRSGSCTWGSFSIAATVAAVVTGSPLPFVPSQCAGYADTRAYERGVEYPTGALPALTDTGADLEDVFTVAGTDGVRAMRCTTTPDGRFYDLWTADDIDGISNAPSANVNDEPAAQDLELAAGTRIVLDVQPNTIDVSAPGFSDVIAAAIVEGVPVEASGPIGTVLDSLGPNDVAPAPVNPSPDSGHAFWLSSYRTNAAGQREFLLENSWGPEWCLNGAGWVSEAFVAQLWALYALRVSVVTATKGAA